MSTKPPAELLYDSEAALRLVDGAIRDIGELGAEEPPKSALRLDQTQPPVMPQIGLIGLSNLMARGYAEILGVLDSVRQSRSLLE
ncbi:MAG: hypothetical protein ABIT38_04715, partial [Gemmatimonadaceae bacterium]